MKFRLIIMGDMSWEPIEFDSLKEAIEQAGKIDNRARFHTRWTRNEDKTVYAFVGTKFNIRIEKV